MNGNAWFDGLPPTTQFLVNAAVLLITVAGGVLAYFMKKPPEAKPAIGGDFVLSAAGFADMNPVREIVRSLDRLTIEAKRLADAQEATTMQEIKQTDILGDIARTMDDQARHADLAREVANQFAEYRRDKPR